jgi:phosphohistidine phosphatase
MSDLPPGGIRPVISGPGPGLVAADLADIVFMDETRRLVVMRHAKAGELPGGPDFERALKARGRSDSTSAGEWLRSTGYRPDAVICSAARRTRQTWQYLSEVLGGQPAVSMERRLYEADTDELMEIISETPDEVQTLLYVGHNPAAAEVVAVLTGAEPHFPTAAIAVIAIPGQWDELGAGEGELQASWTPAGH